MLFWPGYLLIPGLTAAGPTTFRLRFRVSEAYASAQLQGLQCVESVSLFSPSEVEEP